MPLRPAAGLDVALRGLTLARNMCPALATAKLYVPLLPVVVVPTRVWPPLPVCNPEVPFVPGKG